MKRLIDPSNRSGVYSGDLAYGRKNGTMFDKHGDYSGPDNQPIVPLTLVESRDPHVWGRDPYIKDAKKNNAENQAMKNEVINSYMEKLSHLKANFHLTVGKQRF